MYVYINICVYKYKYFYLIFQSFEGFVFLGKIDWKIYKFVLFYNFLLESN